ncbi:LLM class flavin-dependent oxidoreductase [Kineosporia succinea]|uniref:Alkanesulfonate monooxygenase SsuD/methylene tetrahydromethanopterin reductase-like flavin-dependent oxidoreductase (Luciferase family) n=1 Tax=Kineosporia succinea TaxID=84632 RepID=A0ABT9PCE8_9ACTN|nr:LLM class flavin-dependent oxidoreductase [Kineosporia succinea]MDP9830381.1 alkanesulfonate monooxygenase SsuD/methylene tetrahydromethanopterin reductase-like flavin-dependent oxidoreductase (luciferase family) [Kineosporia succinea]
MRIGIGLPNQVRDVRASVIPTWARRAEDAGFATLGTTGRFAYPGVMDTVALAAAAGATTSIGLLSQVLLATTWPAALLAKEAASIDGVSGGRLTLGLGVGVREDDFVVPGHGPRGRGARMDRDLRTYRSLWDGDPVPAGTNPAVPSGTRRVPILFGGGTPAAYRRMAHSSDGYIAGSAPAPLVAGAFDAARLAWREAGRSGRPRLVALNYFALGDPDRGRANVGDYYAATGAYQDLVVSGVHTDAASVRDAVRQFEDLGADELILGPCTDDLDEIARLADIVL